MRNAASRLISSATCLVMLFGCALDASERESEPELAGLQDELTGLNGEERSIAFEGRVLLPVGTTQL